MRSVSARAATALAAILVAVLMAGCAGSTPAATPTTAAVAQATWQAPTPTPWPTLTPTPKPTFTPTPSPSPTPVAGGAEAVIRQMQTASQTMKSARGTVEFLMTGKDEQGQPQSVGMNIAFEQNDPDIHMSMKMAGPEGSAALFDVEFIVKDDVGYMKMGDAWSSFPGGSSQTQAQTNLVNMEEMESFLKDASNLKAVGRRSVKGVECDVVAFTISQAKMQELLDLGGTLPEGVTADDLKMDDFTGEVAIGVTDKMLHQLVYNMAGYAKQAPENDFKMTFTITIWDVNSPDVIITAPADVKPFDFELPSPTPTRKPLG